MSVYRDEKQKSWYVSVRYVDWRGEKSRKVKRGFRTKKEAQEWENEFLNESSGKLEMTFGQFIEVYEENLKQRLRLTTWQTKVCMSVCAGDEVFIGVPGGHPVKVDGLLVGSVGIAGASENDALIAEKVATTIAGELK